ncbi:MAG: hypothetical protein ACK5C0_08840 [Candidatus Kapaibacterium sp.]|jgi:hypothetical protein
MKNTYLWGLVILCLSSMTLSSCKEHSTDSATLPNEIKSIDYFISNGHTSQPMPNQLLITKDSIVFHWSISVLTTTEPRTLTLKEKRIVFQDTALFQSMVAHISVNELWNYQDIYGDNNILPDKGGKRLTFTGNDNETKSIFIWDESVPPQKLYSYSKILDSLVNAYKIQYPIL